MKTTVLMICLLLSLVTKLANATSFGRLGSADILTVDGAPAICTPRDAGEPLLVGTVTVSESYITNPGSWGITLQEGALPLALKPGECISFGSVPEGFGINRYTTKKPPLQLEVNRTYLFSIYDAYKTRDTYAGNFCVSQKADGKLEYREYTRLSDGTTLIPSCDTLKHRASSLKIPPWQQ